MTMLSPIIAGTMKWGDWGAKFSTAQYEAMIADCLAAGVHSFDHADIYGHYTTEAEFGKALLGKSSLRSSLQLITKCGIKMIAANRPQHSIKHYDTGRSHILQSVEQSLLNFNTDYIDVLLLHRPHPLLHPQEIAAAFTQLKEQGKVRALGVSNFTASQMALIQSCFALEYNQLEISVTALSCFTNGTLDYCITHGIRPMAWAPLGGGNIFTAGSEQHQRITAVAALLAQRHAATPDQVLLAWLLRHPAGIAPVTGTSKPARISAAMEATRLQLNTEEWFMLWRASTGKEVP